MAVLKLDRGLKDGPLSMYSILLDGKQVGEVGVSSEGDSLHFEFIELDPGFRGLGLSQRVQKLILGRYPKCKNISGEITNKRAFYSLNKVLGYPNVVEGKLENLPGEASYTSEGRISSKDSILVRWVRQ